jgi:hypothetical protein
MKRKDILLAELLFDKEDVIYTLVRSTTDKYCKGTCKECREIGSEYGCCLPDNEKGCIKAWLDSEVPRAGEFFTE